MKVQSSVFSKIPKWFYGCSLATLLLAITITSTIFILDSQDYNRHIGCCGIVILKNRHFKTKYDFPGKGSEDDPYIIENYKFNSTHNFGILIDDVSVSFIIRNCTIQAKHNDIVLEEVTSKKCLVENNVCENSINIIRSQGIIIRNNTCSSKIDVANSAHIIIEKNHCQKIETSNGINYNIAIRDNICHSSDYGIELHDAVSCTISSNICFNNTNAGIYAPGIENSLFYNNSCYRNGMGIDFYWSEKNSFLYNNCSFNNGFGFSSENSQQIILTNNFCANNTLGMFFLDMLNLSITNNMFVNNSVQGIALSNTYEECEIYHNNFFNNNQFGYPQALDYCNSYYMVSWYNPRINEGNYWSDLVWNEGAIYEIYGCNNTDPYPFENPLDI